MAANKFRAVLFDLDGTLIDAPNWHRDAFNRALIATGHDPLRDDEHQRTFNGLSTKKKLEILSTQGRIGYEALREIENLKQRYTVEAIEKYCKPVARVIDVVNRAVSNGKVGVVTNCSRATAEMMLSKSNLLPLLDILVSNDDVDGKYKPDPEPYIVAINRLKLWPSLCLAVEDTAKGANSARAAGCALWRLNSFEDLTVETLEKYL